jgi:hypothetical protein
MPTTEEFITEELFKHNAKIINTDAYEDWVFEVDGQTYNLTANRSASVYGLDKPKLSAIATPVKTPELERLTRFSRHQLKSYRTPFNKDNIQTKINDVFRTIKRKSKQVKEDSTLEQATSNNINIDLIWTMAKAVLGAVLIPDKTKIQGRYLVLSAYDNRLNIAFDYSTLTATNIELVMSLSQDKTSDMLKALLPHITAAENIGEVKITWHNVFDSKEVWVSMSHKLTVTLFDFPDTWRRMRALPGIKTAIARHMAEVLKK